MLKSWFDIEATWSSTLTSVHNQIRIAEYQVCGRFNMPDYLTTGAGGQTRGQYRSQFLLWAVLGAPLILGNDVRQMDSESIALDTAPEVIAVDQDQECV